MPNGIIAIGELLHASIPKPGKAMRELNAMGADAYTTPSEALDYIKEIIETQAEDGAAYIGINVDDFVENDPSVGINLMKEYVRLVRKWSKGVPACIDSSDDAVLLAGLEEWYNTDKDVKPPMMNSIKVYSMDAMMPLKKKYDFTFVGLLMSETQPTGPGGSHSVDELFGLAKALFDKAVDEFGFKPEEIYFDATVFPLAIDMPMMPNVPGYTYRTFETLKRIKADPRMKDVHFSMGISNCCRDLPGRKIGICRAYVEKAMEYGLDAGIVNPSHHFGEKPADPELVKLVEAFAVMDGSADKTNDAMMLMGQFCMDTKK